MSPRVIPYCGQAFQKTLGFTGQFRSLGGDCKYLPWKVLLSLAFRTKSGPSQSRCTSFRILSQKLSRKSQSQNDQSGGRQPCKVLDATIAKTNRTLSARRDLALGGPFAPVRTIPTTRLSACSRQNATGPPTHCPRFQSWHRHHSQLVVQSRRLDCGKSGFKRAGLGGEERPPRTTV